MLYNEVAEKNIIGAIICEDSAISTVKNTGLTAEDFATELSLVYQIALELNYESKKIDIVKIIEKARAKGIESINFEFLTKVSIESYDYSSQTIESNCNVLKELSKKRVLKSSIQDILKDIESKPVETVTSNLKDITALSQCYNTVDDSIVTSIDIDDSESTRTVITTGFEFLDKALNGLRGGTLNIIAGESGAGKSTLVNQIIINAVATNKKVFLYSGELRNQQAIDWVYRTLANEKDLAEYKNKFTGTTEYRVKDDAKWKMRQWINGKMFLHKDTVIANLDRLLIELEHLAVTKGVKLFVLDNLMSINAGTDSTDLYSKQRLIVSKLKEAAQKLDIAVILVAHNRKSKENAGSKGAHQFDISGSSEVPSYADTVTIIRRSDEEAENGSSKTSLSIVKNRNNGVILKDFSITFNSKRKRFFELFDDELNKDYGYNKNICEENQLKIKQT